MVNAGKNKPYLDAMGKEQPKEGKYTIHRSYGLWYDWMQSLICLAVMVGKKGPKLTKTPQKIGHPKRECIFQPTIFRGYVSFRDSILFRHPESFRL